MASPQPALFPSGFDPNLFPVDRIRRHVERAAYFTFFSVPDPARPIQPIMAEDGSPHIVALDVNEQLHRLQIQSAVPTSGGGVRAVNRVGEPTARVHIRWTLAPDSFEPAPGVVPPPTPLNPMASQSFSMLEARLEIGDAQRSSFRAFGRGRTFPAMVGGQPQLFVGSIVNAVEGFGRFQNLPFGNCAVNGRIKPPSELALAIILRYMDPNRKLAGSGIRPIRSMSNPDPEMITLIFRSEEIPDNPVTLIHGDDGRIIGANVHEALRLVETDFDLGGAHGLRSRTVVGPLVGEHHSTLAFDPGDPRPVTSLQTLTSEFLFFDRHHRRIGMVSANMVEGDAFRTPIDGALVPLYRFDGFGPIEFGEGPFAGVAGMMSVNGAVCVFPRAVSNLYVLRIFDPEGKFRATSRRAWAR